MVKEYLLGIGDKDYRVIIESYQDGEGRVLVDGRPFTVRLKSGGQPAAWPESKPAPAPSPTRAKATLRNAAATGEKALRAPMPGVVRQIMATVGDMVKAGQPLVVMEAMKMENQLVAPVDGKVAIVAVAAGASVNTGDLIVSFE